MTDLLTQNNDLLFGKDGSIGDILVAAGRLAAADIERIAQYQQLHQLPFGEAAQALKLLSREDIDYALSRQFDYAYLSLQNTSLSPELVVAYKPTSRVGESLRALRSQLLLRWLGNNTQRKALALVSPDRNDGRSFMAANLAVVFAQQGQRTLLIDANLRHPRQHLLFKTGKNPGLAGLLAQRAMPELVTPVEALPLSLLPAGLVPPNPQELLGRSSFGELLLRAEKQFDVVLIDTPAGSECSDDEIIATSAGAALLVVRQHHSVLSHAARLAQRLTDSGVSVVGSVINDV